MSTDDFGASGRPGLTARELRTIRAHAAAGKLTEQELRDLVRAAAQPVRQWQVKRRPRLTRSVVWNAETERADLATVEAWNASAEGQAQVHAALGAVAAVHAAQPHSDPPGLNDENLHTYEAAQQIFNREQDAGNVGKAVMQAVCVELPKYLAADRRPAKLTKTGKQPGKNRGKTRKPSLIALVQDIALTPEVARVKGNDEGSVRNAVERIATNLCALCPGAVPWLADIVLKNKAAKPRKPRVLNRPHAATSTITDPGAALQAAWATPGAVRVDPPGSTA